MRELCAESVSPFFIIGSGRSGSSLLRKMLNCHPALGLPEESHFYNTFYPNRDLYYPLAAEENVAALIGDALQSFHIKHWLPALSTERVLDSVTEFSFGGVFEALMRTWIKTQGKRYWGEKTPQHVYFWNEILLDFPRARFIHVVRDGRDVALSYRKARFGPKGFAAAAYRWNRELNIVEELRSVLPASRLHEIRYEDLLADPGNALEHICCFLGVDFHPAMMKFTAGPDSLYVEKTNRQNLEATLLLDNSSKWVSQASRRELDIYESIAAEKLAYYGYQLTTPSRRLSRVDQKIFYYLHDVPCKLLSLPLNIDGIQCEMTRKLLAWRRRRLRSAEDVRRGGWPEPFSK